MKYGQGSKLDELNAQVDLNNDSISYNSAKKDYLNTKRNFNLLLGRNITIGFDIDTTVVFKQNLEESKVLNQAESDNIQSLLSTQNVLLSELDVDISKARFLPKLNGSLSYNWNESMNPPSSFALNNEAYGVNLGLSLTWNIFDGGSNKTRTKTAKLNNENRAIELYQVKEEVKTEAYNIYNDYTTKQYTLRAERVGVETNTLNFSKTQKQFSLGQVSAIEYRQAQINLLNSLNNLAKAKYDLKIAELLLLQVTGSLLE